MRFLLNTEAPEDVRRKAVAEWGLSEAQAEAVANVSLVPGYGDIGETAIGKLLPHLEKGLLYSDAVKAAGYDHHSDFRNDEAHDNLPYYGQVLPRDAVGADPKKDPDKDGEPARYGRFPNPTVHIGLNQLRRVANRLIESYGKPEEIVVELARDLKMNREEKQKLLKQQREGGERNKRFTEMLEAAEKGQPTADALRKLRLWEEQGPPMARVCPYTGQVLSFEMVASSQTEVDHILPFSRILDDSAANMVVCVARANRAKGDRPPHEAFGHSPQGYNYQEILARVAKLPENKRWRFQPDAMEEFEKEDRFLDRQLNETRYLSRTARTYLAYLYDEKNEGTMRVRATPGRMSALLRRGWGLNNMLRADGAGEIVREKTRDDHRHHAIDAFVVACTTQGLLKKFADASGASRDAEERLAAAAGQATPWDGFERNQLKPFLDRLVVSYKPDHGTRGAKGKTTGQLHNDTAYGLVKLSEDGPSTVVVRKKLSAFMKRDDLDAVRDDTMGEALKELWDQVESEINAEGGNLKQLPARFAGQAANEGVLRDGSLQTVRRVRVLEQQTVIPIRRRAGDRDAGKPYKGYLPGGNEFADVWRMPDKGRSWKMVVVSTFDANQPDLNIEDLRPHPAAKKLMRLHIDDMGALGDGANRRIVRVRKMSKGLVWLDAHNETNVDARVRKKELKEAKYSANQLREHGFRKVGVDEIGRVLDPGPPKA